MKKLVPLVTALTLISGAAWAAQAGESGSQTKQPFKSSETTVPKQSSEMETQSSQGAESQAAQRPFKSSETLDSKEGGLSEKEQEAQEAQANALNELLKSELASVETYRQALDKFRQESQQAAFQQLNTIYQDHQDAVSQLKTQVREAGGEVAEGSGVWGAWAKLVMGSAKLLGDETAIKTLKEGEESGVEDDQKCLREGNLSSEAKNLIQTTLLPKQQIHVQDLDKLIQNVSSLEEETE